MHKCSDLSLAASLPAMENKSQFSLRTMSKYIERGRGGGYEHLIQYRFFPVVLKIRYAQNSVVNSAVIAQEMADADHVTTMR